MEWREGGLETLLLSPEVGIAVAATRSLSLGAIRFALIALGLVGGVFIAPSLRAGSFDPLMFFDENVQRKQIHHELVNCQNFTFGLFTLILMHAESLVVSRQH